MSDSLSRSNNHSLQNELSSGLTDFAAHAYDSFKYNLLQEPLTGAMQLVDHCANTDLEENQVLRQTKGL